MPPPKKHKKRRALVVVPATAGPHLPGPIPDIPPHRVGAIVQSFITSDGVKQMDVNEQADGNFTVNPLR